MNTINTHPVRQTALPILSALIWGTSFVAQSVGADYLSPFSFNTIRSAIGFLSLLTVCAVLRLRRSRRGEPSPGGPAYRRALVVTHRTDGLAGVAVLPRDADGVPGTWQELAFDEPLYDVDAESDPDYDTDRIRLGYESMVTPASDAAVPAVIGSLAVAPGA